ncbi:hypothetical protein BDW42DRAFT_158598 [Aspergillus taichungensis]|uniref:ER-bound oxygenase mpaB/mpaB'/Rubber oxygenase catalytic domain-containing protein n=1 Tax=Aspergillus taichungensis TaxID=482145 RepID=A0A2J5I8Y8_9EURO|nr:hypothetical protein BDW42DRAFT_158598 [Aspergillus taichungensis]
MTDMKNTTGNRIVYDYWDYQFEWTDAHLPHSAFEPLTRTCDTLADECNEVLDKIIADSDDTGTPLRADRYALLRDHHKSHPALDELWTQINTVPEWVDWDQIHRAQDIFWRYLVPITNVLSFQSLLGGMGAIRVGETLSRTGGFSPHVVRRRLLETAQHTLQVHRLTDGMNPGGEGQIASVRVRLLHSAVRRRIMSLVEEDPNYYDVEKFGLPINDLDSFATINTFSGTVVWLGLPRQGIHLSDQEIEDYIALWRLVGHYMGAPTDFFETAAWGKIVSESMIIHEFAPADTGRVLARNIAIGLENTAPLYASKGYIDALTRLFNGDRLADELHIPPTNWYYRVLMWGYCFWVKTQAKTVAKVPFIDRFMIESRRKMAWNHLLSEGTGLGKQTLFEFKYVPALNRLTLPGQQKSYIFKRPGIEMLSYLGLFSAFASATSICIGVALVTARLFPKSRGVAAALAQSLQGHLALLSSFRSSR